MKSYTIATLGSHSALQILKGAKDEGFETLLFAKKDSVLFYKQFSFINSIVSVSSYREVINVDSVIKGKQLILIPHGSFVAYLGEDGNKQLKIPYFGNKKVLDWEANRHLQLRWFEEAHITIPKIFSSTDQIDRPVIIKSYGAAGGHGYRIATTQKELERAKKTFTNNEYLIQEYILGVPIYLHFFYSPLHKKIELLSIDRRYETNVDGIGRIPLSHQKMISIDPSFVVVGNSPLVLRESLLPQAFKMADQFIKASQTLIDKRGIFGPFCLETIVTPDQQFYVIEASCRIVAGTNLFINGSPYASLYYDEPMSTGRRIAREIKIGIETKKINLLLD